MRTLLLVLALGLAGCASRNPAPQAPGAQPAPDPQDTSFHERRDGAAAAGSGAQ